MCGRTGQAILPEVIEERWDARVPAEYEPRYNVAPGEDLAVVPNDRPGEVALKTWGLLPGWVDDPGDWAYPINARAETVEEKPAFREAFDRRPCVVLSSGYYEWAGERGSKQPYRICRTDREPFAFAGLWESWSDNGEKRTSVTILTCEPNEVVAPIHDRMPVVLEQTEEATWLHGDPDARRRLLDPGPGDAFEAYPISRDINDPTYEKADVVEPLGHEQRGFGDVSA